MPDNDFHTKLREHAEAALSYLNIAGMVKENADLLDLIREEVDAILDLNKEEILKRVEIRAGHERSLVNFFEGHYTGEELDLEAYIVDVTGQEELEEVVREAMGMEDDRSVFPVEDLLSPIPPTTVRSLIQERLNNTD